jgi:long-chain-fatty-acid---luciferin-component ligase
MDYEIDAFLDEPDPWRMDPDAIRVRKFAAIRQAFVHHYANCGVYRNFCDARGFNPDMLDSYGDLARIPLISTRAFKEGLSLLSVPQHEIVKVLHSSGTSGNRSRVPRDGITLTRFMKSLKQTILNVQGGSGYVAMLGPSPDELGDLAFANWARAGCELAEDHEFFLKNLSFDPAYCVERVNATKIRPVQIGGAPMLILTLADFILKSGNRITTLTAESRITSGGGFKTLTGELVPRDEYDRRLVAAFGVDRSNIRDVYSMTEINGMISECARGVLHVPPWMHLSVRNPANLDEEIVPGAEGMPGFLDPCAHSYPGFVIADDIVRVAVAEGDRCACGRVGPCLDRSVRRAEGAEARGCGRHIEELRAGAAV